MFNWFKRKPKQPNLEEMATQYGNPLDVIRNLHLKALRTKNDDLLLATTTALGVMQGMGQAAERMGAEKREMVEMFAAVVYAAGGEVIVKPQHAIQVPYLVLIKEQMIDGSMRWQSGSRQ